MEAVCSPLVPESFTYADTLLRRAVENRAVPSAVAVAGDGSGVKYRAAYGFARAFADDSPVFDPVPAEIPAGAVPATLETLYDMASLTKLMSTAMVALKFLEAGEITMYDPLPRFFENVPADKRDISIRRLLTHTSGIPAHFHLSDATGDPAKAADAILARPLSRPVGSDVEYSCMGFILLGKILEKIGGAPLDKLARELVFDPLGMTHTGYNPPRGLNAETAGNIYPADNIQFAATEYNKQAGRYLSGVVHDENARFLGGVSANAGVFSRAADLERFAAMLSNRGETPSGRFLSRNTFDASVKNRTPGMSEARGWGFSLAGEGMTAMGDLFSPGSYGHNGFTGTSLYVDSETGVYAVLLTNRVHFTRQSDGLYRLRRVFHNAVAANSRASY